MQHIAYITVGKNKGNARIWLEGKPLIHSNFTAGQPIDISIDKKNKEIRLSLSNSGSRKVTSSKRRGGESRPIIDLCNATVTKVFSGIKKVKVLFKQGLIFIFIHPEEQARIERKTRLEIKLQKQEPLLCGSVAHGGGIMDHAIHQGLNDVGILSSLMLGIEIKPEYLGCSIRNNSAWHPDGIAIQGPMEEVEMSDLPQLDIFHSGIPCTGASKAGRSKNKIKYAEEHSSAGALFLSFLNILREVNPAIVVLENVPEYAHTMSMAVIRKSLTSWGYHVHERVLNGNQMGALENRDRFVMIAVTEGIEFNFADLQPVREKERSLKEIMDFVELDSPAWREFSYLKTKEAADKKAGKGFKMQILDENAPLCGTIGRGYAKIRSTEPKIAHPENPRLMRQFSVSEHAKVKGVPEFLVDGCSATTAHEILGQSVIYPVFQALGRLIGNTLNKWLIVETIQSQRQLSIWDLQVA